MPVCVYLVGVSSSGKTTYASELLKSDYFSSTNTTYISSDRERCKLTGSTSNLTEEDRLWKFILPRLTINALIAGDNVIFDAIAPYARARRDWIDLGKEIGRIANMFDFPRHILECHFFEANLERSIANNKLKEKPVSEDTIMRQCENWEEPTMNEGFDVVVNLDKMDGSRVEEKYNWKINQLI